MSGIYVKGVSEDFGPFSVEDLRRVGVSPGTFVRPANAGPDEWIEASELSAFLEDSIVDHEASPENQMYWGDITPKECRNGMRTYSAILWGIPWGQSWEEACATMPATVNGIFFPRPTRCVNTGLNMWGEWDVPDPTCGAPAGAVEQIPQCVFFSLGFAKSNHFQGGRQLPAYVVNIYLRRNEFFQKQCPCPQISETSRIAARLFAFDGAPDLPAEGWWVFRDRPWSNAFSFGARGDVGMTQQIMPKFVTKRWLDRPMFALELFIKSPMGAKPLTIGPGQYPQAPRGGIWIPPMR